MSADRLFYKSSGHDDEIFDGNRLVLVVDEDDDDAKIYLQTQRNDSYNETWVVLGDKAQAMDLAAQIAFHAQFLEDKDDAD